MKSSINLYALFAYRWSSKIWTSLLPLKPRSGREVWTRCVALGVLAMLAACHTAYPPLDVVDEVDLDRYVGRWYEIASFPQRFQEGCVATTATYTRLDATRIRVVNECRDGSFDGELRRAEGSAWVVDPATSAAKLEVQFFWPFRGDYWVIDLDPEYRHAVIGHPSRNYLWILSRTPTLDSARLQALLTRIEAHGYELERGVRASG